MNLLFLKITANDRKQFDVDFVRAYHQNTNEGNVNVSSHTFYDPHTEEYTGFIYYYE